MALSPGGSVDGAKACFHAALRKNSNHYLSLSFLAEILLREGSPDAASFFTRALKSDSLPRHCSLWNLAHIAMAAKQYHSAASFYDTVASEDPSLSFYALTNSISAYSLALNSSRAEAVAKRARRLSQDAELAVANHAAALVNVRKFDAAAALVLKALPKATNLRPQLTLILAMAQARGTTPALALPTLSTLPLTTLVAAEVIRAASVPPPPAAEFQDLVVRARKHRPPPPTETAPAPVVSYGAAAHVTPHPLWNLKANKRKDCRSQALHAAMREGLLGGWAISPLVFEFVERIAPVGGVLEFGSGAGTRALRFVRPFVASVEHDHNFVGVVEGVEYIHAPLRKYTPPRGFESQREYYDLAVLRPALLKLKDRYSVVIVDGPTAATGRAGFLLVMDLISERAVVIFDDTHRPEELALAVAFARARGKRLLTFSAEDKKFTIAF